MNVQSVKIGVEFGKRIAVGGGVAFLSPNTPVYHAYTYYDSEIKRDTILSRKLSLTYFCYYFNYVYYRSKRWELSIPIQLGVGKLSYTYQYRGNNRKDDEGFCFLYEPVVNVKFKMLKWVGVEGDIGYRLLFKDKSNLIKNTFNSPLLAVGVFIVWDELALMCFPKNKRIEKKFGPSQW